MSSGASNAKGNDNGGSGDDAVAVSTMAPPSASKASSGSQDERETAEQPSMEASKAEMVSAGSVQVWGCLVKDVWYVCGGSVIEQWCMCMPCPYGMCVMGDQSRGNCLVCSRSLAYVR